MDWTVKSFKELFKEELYEILRLRCEVFIVEQNAPYQDLDRLDYECFHVMGKSDGKIIAYSRIIPIGVKYKDAYSIGRFIVKKEYRRRGLAKELLDVTLNSISSKEGLKSDIKKVRITAQEYISKFYETSGFRYTSEVYIEELRPHITMEMDDVSKK